jgi:hypothetical protein
MTLTIRDPDRRRRKPLAVHEGLDTPTARELRAIRGTREQSAYVLPT